MEDLIKQESNIRCQIIREYRENIIDLLRKTLNVDKSVIEIKLFIDTIPLIIKNNFIKTYQLETVAKLNFINMTKIDYPIDNIWQAQQTNGYKNYIKIN